MRHNALRDTEAKLLQEVCKDVRVEPGLLPVEGEQKTGNIAEMARLDVSARGLWSEYQKTYMDVRITHPTAESHMRKTLDQLYRENELEKKRDYSDRVIHTEKGTFTPLVFTTTGGMGPECTRMNKRIAELISIRNISARDFVLLCCAVPLLQYVVLEAHSEIRKKKILEISRSI